MADHSKPLTTSTYANFVTELDGRFDDLSVGLDPAVTTATNLITNSIRWSSASLKWQKWNGTTWNDLAASYSININGTVGATTPAAGAFTTLSSTGNTTLGDAAADTVTINGTIQPGVLVSGSSSSNMFRITQTGTGNAFVVEDETNPDSTPFVIEAGGDVGIGTTNPVEKLSVVGQISTSGAVGGFLLRDRATSASSSQWYSPSVGNTRLFDTTTSTDRIVIDANGNVGIGTTALTVTALRISKSITGSTAAQGIRVDGGIQTDVTSNASYFQAVPAMASGTLSTLNSFEASQGTIGATVTAQVGFRSRESLIAATSNYGFFANDTNAVTAGKTAYGFYSAVNTATGGGTTYGFYAAGTASNYFGGRVGIGTTANYQLAVVGGATQLSGSTAAAAGLRIQSVAGVATLTGINADNDTNFPISLITGASSITMDTSGIVTGTAGNLMLVRGTAVASTSGTSIDFTGIPSWVKRITVMFNGVSTNGSSFGLVQLGDSGGVENTGYTGSNAFSGGSSTGANPTTGFGFGNNGAAFTFSGNMTITNVSGNIWAAACVGGSTNTALAILGGGNKTLSAVLDRVRITTVNGTDTFDAGSINILYE